MKLANNFYLDEFTKSQTASRHGINNIPSEQNIENLKLLTRKILQPVRDKFGVVIISSGFRNPMVNSLIGGSPSSQHMEGQATDFEVLYWDNYTIACWIRDNLEFDQLILEFYTLGKPYSGWIHVSYSHNNRNQCLTSFHKNNKIMYRSGLIL